jgi:uncharacterized ferritin-like protein (DUF455 family)
MAAAKEIAFARNAPEEAEADAIELPSSLFDAAMLVLQTAGAFAKARLTERVGDAWFRGELNTDEAHIEVPLEPARPSYVRVVDPKAVSNRGRKSAIHALVHAESCAIDLSWDIVARFGPTHPELPRAFLDDWVRVAMDEADHFRSWHARLESVGASYGTLDAHSSLWESAMATAGSLSERLCIVHCVHEARGLDVYPTGRERLLRADDAESVGECSCGVGMIASCGVGMSASRSTAGPERQNGGRPRGLRSEVAHVDAGGAGRMAVVGPGGWGGPVAAERRCERCGGDCGVSPRPAGALPRQPQTAIQPRVEVGSRNARVLVRIRRVTVI